jgi:hypothetical protein
MISETGMSLISYWGPMSAGSRRCRRDNDLVWENGLASSMAKLWMWDKLVTLIRRGDADVESAGERKDCAGEGWAAADPDGATDRAAVLDGVGCCDCGCTRGLGGGRTACWGVGRCDAESAASACCERWADVVVVVVADDDDVVVVELGGGASVSAIGTSAGATATRAGGFGFAEGDGRTGVWCTAEDSCVCACPLPPPNMVL